jgi:uncharacterized protein YggE
MPFQTQTNFFRRAALVGVFAIAGLAIACTGAPTEAQAEADDGKRKPGRMTITGQGIASAVPDLAQIQVGVTSEAKTAREALTANSAAMNRVFNTLEDKGVAKKDMQTSNFNVSPTYRTYPRGTTGPREIIGYTVSNNLTVIVRDLDNLGAVLDTTVSDGANQFYGLSFGFAETQPLMDKARKEAVADARRKAELYTEAAGVTLGRIISIAEHGGGGRPQPMARSAGLMEADVPIAAGESNLSAQVSLTYELP